jgi:hypothetical protein
MGPQERSAVTILVNSFGRTWTEDGSRTSWDKAFKKASLEDLHFHDLRGTYLGGRVELAESAIKKLSAVYGQAQKRELGTWLVTGEGVHRSPRLVRERALHVAGNRIAQPSHQSLKTSASTETEQKLPTERSVLIRNRRKSLKGLVGAPGLEPGTR